MRPGLGFEGTVLPKPGDADEYNLQATEAIPGDSDDDEDFPDDSPQAGGLACKRAGSPLTQDEQPAKRGRIGIAGGKAATTKPISQDGYDTDDARIIALKQQGYSDERVAHMLIHEGRVRYVPKTVGSRWLRLRKVQAQHDEDKLDDELSDWHIGDDDHLRESFNVIEQKYELEMQKLMDKKWKDVSTNLAERLQKKKYTGKACKERLEALEDGTALRPIELDPDKEGRAQMRIARIAEAKQRRADAAWEAKSSEREAERRKQEKKAFLEAKQQERDEAEQAKKAQQAEDKRIKVEKKAGREALRAAKAQFEAEEKRKLEQKKHEWELMNAAYAQVTGGMSLHPRRNKAKVDDDADGSADDEDYGDASDLADGDEDDAGGSDDAGSNIDVSMVDTPTRPKKKSVVSKAARVTKETLQNPRSVMTDAEIDVLLFERDLSRRGSRESHPQVVARLAAHDNDLSVSDLHDLLGKFFDKGKGNKAAKTRRLQEYEAGASAAGSDGVKATDPEFVKRYEGYEGEYAGFLDNGGVEKA